MKQKALLPCSPKRVAKAMLLPLLLSITSCYKDEVDPAALKNNPFDPGYNGPLVFSFDTTYVRETPIPGFPPLIRQAFEFSAKSSLFLHPTTYQVHVRDLDNGFADVIDPIVAGGDRFRYSRVDQLHGQPLCVEVSLSNSGSTSGKETVCGTLP